VGNSDKTNKPDDDKTTAEIANSDGIEEAVVEDEAVGDVSGTAEPETLKDPESVASDETEGVDDLSIEDNEVVGGVDEPAVEPGVEETPSVVEPAKRGGFVPLVLGGVIAAGLGFGGAVYFGDQLGIGAKSSDAIAKISEELAAQSDTLKALHDRTTQATDAALTASQTAKESAVELEKLRELHDAKLDSLSEAVAGFETRLSDIEKRPLNEGLGAAAIAAYEREVEDLKTLVAEQKAEAMELKDRADLSAKTALARSATTRIIAALDSGAAFSGAVVDYRSATGEGVAEVLADHAETGVITLVALTEAFPEAARAALAKARSENVDDAQGSKLGNFLKTHLGARSVEAKEGNDTDAILSRAEAALRSGQLAETLAELDALADAPKAVMADWRAQAETRLAAMQAAEAMAQALNTK